MRVCVCVLDRSSYYKYRFRGQGEVTKKAQEEGNDPRPFSWNAEMPENETDCNSTHSYIQPIIIIMINEALVMYITGCDVILHDD